MNVFEGKTAVISGGAEGIGLSIAKALAQQGMQLVLADINEESLVKASSAPNGSSINRTSALTASARARPTRWRIPPESSWG